MLARREFLGRGAVTAGTAAFSGQAFAGSGGGKTAAGGSSGSTRLRGRPGDLETDVLIVGGGIQGVCLAAELRRAYSVCLVDTGSTTGESLHNHGFVTAGYPGSDENQMRAYRDSARDWRKHLAELGVVVRSEEIFYVIPDDAPNPARWSSLGLGFERTDPPPPFENAELDGYRVYRADEEMIFDPAVALGALRAELSTCMLWGRVRALARYGARVATDAGAVTVRARFVLLAAGAANASLVLSRLGPASEEKTNRCQVVRSMHMVCVRGELPLSSGGFFHTAVVAHRLGSDTVWLVTFHPDPDPLVPGRVDMHVDPRFRPEVLRGTVSQLRRLVPDFDRWANRLRWASYAGWKTETPLAARSDCPDPLPFAMDSFGEEDLLAVWPSLWGNALPAARAAAERVSAVLGDRKHRDLDLETSTPPKHPARWAGPDLVWSSWGDFRREHGL